jgi:3-methylcrotonyl-CoA carboxylase alpha subunit
VTRGQKLVVLEAMKMEHTILAPADGTVERVRFAAGEQTAEGEELVVFAAAEG